MSITQSTRVSLDVVAVVVALVASGAGWVTYMTWEMRAMRKDVVMIKNKLGIPEAEVASVSLIPESMAGQETVETNKGKSHE